MNNNTNTKKQWQAPKIIDLNVKDTKGGWFPGAVEQSISSFSSTYVSS